MGDSCHISGIFWHRNQPVILDAGRRQDWLERQSGKFVMTTQQGCPESARAPLDCFLRNQHSPEPYQARFTLKIFFFNSQLFTNAESYCSDKPTSLAGSEVGITGSWLGPRDGCGMWLTCWKRTGERIEGNGFFSILEILWKSSFSSLHSWPSPS